MNKRNENNMPNKPLSCKRRVQLKLLLDVCAVFFLCYNHNDFSISIIYDTMRAMKSNKHSG